MMLAVIAVLVAGESAVRLVSPERIDFSTALLVAVIGLAVNLLSAWLLRDSPHDHGCGHDHRDNNREAALIHVLSDALTSALAIVALWCGRRYGLVWLDPLMGMRAAVILLWSANLLRRSADALLDVDVAPVPNLVAVHAPSECGHHH